MKGSNTDATKGFLYSLGGVVLLSTNFVTAKYGLQGFNPETFSLVWTSAAAIYAFAIVLASPSSRVQVVPQGSLKAMLSLGIATGVGMLLAWEGLSRLDPAFASFLWRFFPVVTILSGVVLLKERLSKQEILSMTIMLLGSLWSVAGRWESVGMGALLTILAGCAGTVQLLIAKLQTHRVHPNVLVAYRVGIGSVCIAGWTVFTGAADFSVGFSYWCVTLLGAFLGPCASFLLTFRAYKYWTLSQSTIVLTAQPLLVLPMAYLFLGTLPTLRELVGGGMILTGAFWLAFIQVTKGNRRHP
ncbi:MAG: DMT family transporter [Thermodesulfobacteriota bacterium]|nr:DMT family transporter [Thermodesulfobacteriota bacterium]